MDIRQITPAYFVSPQINPEDMAHLRNAGITTIICNRPDGEVPASHQAAAIQAEAEAHGIAFHVLPLTHQSFTPDNIARHRSIVAEAPGPCLAYCASGTRSCFAWAMGQAGTAEISDIQAAAAQAGYDISPILPALDKFALDSKPD